MKTHEISPTDVRPDPNNPNWTKPRSYGLWELLPAAGGKRYRYGNYPIRGVELTREFGNAKLVALYTSRLSAKSSADDLN